MKNLPLPNYDVDVARYHGDWTPQEAMDFIYERGITRVAVDTETYYDPEQPGVIRFIKGAPNNRPFGLSMTARDPVSNALQSWWFTDADLFELSPLLSDEKIAKILHNSKFDMHMLANLGLDLRGRIWDTMIMIHLIDEEHMCRTPAGGKVKSKALKNLAYHYLGDDGHYLESLVDETRRVIGLNSERLKGAVSYKEVSDANPILMKDYACSDTEYCYLLFEKFLPQIVAQELSEAYETDINANFAVFIMERVGVKVDMEYYTKLEDELTAQMLSITDEISTIIPNDLNIRSARDLVEGFKGLGVEWQWYTEKGELRTDDKVLKQFTEGEPGRLAQKVLEYRDCAKVRDTFISQIKQYVQNGRIHANFNVCPNESDSGGTVTGRLSSSDPNLHNIPKDDKRVRLGIVPTEDYLLVEMDYDQQEYRLLAHYAKDENFMAIVHAGKDIHIGTAELMFGLTTEQASEKKNRSKGKTLNFGMVYGLGAASLAVSLGHKINVGLYNVASAALSSLGIKPWELPAKEDILKKVSDPGTQHAIEYYFSEEAQHAVAEAKEMKGKYFGQFPDIQQFLKDCRKKTQQRGWVKTWTGRRRHFKNPAKEGYKGPNAVIQGGCGDIIKQKMYLITMYFIEQGVRSRIVNNIHDALLYEIHKSELYLLPIIKAMMEDLPFRVPITASVEIAEKNWGGLEKCTDELLESLQR